MKFNIFMNCAYSLNVGDKFKILGRNYPVVGVPSRTTMCLEMPLLKYLRFRLNPLVFRTIRALKKRRWGRFLLGLRCKHQWLHEKTRVCYLCGNVK